MNAMRDRAKEQFPMVLLTLLSIVQALALELLWSHVTETNYLLTFTWTAVFALIQVVATFMAVVLVWLVYASNMMRLRWVPVTADSVYPFIIGMFEFMLVESLDPGETGQWIVLLTIIFAIMVRASHKSMQRARMDGDNESFFSRFAPATIRDFIPELTTIFSMAMAGIYIWVSDDRGIFTLLVLLTTLCIMTGQFYLTTVFWRQSVIAKPELDDSDGQT